MQQNQDAIEAWLKEVEPSSKKLFDYDFGRTIGYGLTKGEDILRPKNKAAVVLQKRDNGEIKILTSYPINE